MADSLIRPASLADLPRVLALSARDPEALAALRRRLADRLEHEPATAPDDLSRTLHTGRERFPCRDAVIGTDTAELALLLRESDGENTPPVREPGAGPVLVLDGSPAPASVPDLPEITDALRRAEDACRDGADDTAARAAAVQYGVVAWLLARGVTPHAVHGHGAGAWAAAAARGELPLSAALRAAAENATPPAGAQQPPVGAPADSEPRTTPVVVIGSHPPPTATESVADVTGCPDPLRLDTADGASYARLLAELWRLGFDVDTTLGRAGRRIRLPGHPFRRREPGGAGPADGPTTRALTPFEQRWLFYDLVRHGSSGDHNVTVETVLPGPAPAPADIATAFDEIQRRHPVLRTVFSDPAGRWRARTLPTATVRPTHLTSEPDAGPEQLRAAVRDAARQPLRLRDEPLLRCCIRAGSAHWALSLGLYEPLSATADPRLLLDELRALLGAEPAVPAAPLPEPEPEPA
ncbi:hypothetical protein ACFYPT_10430 [Streptomyces sp. NPDC005529]|uniref:CurL C-terminal domain-containing protein n=1 Tax=unclassified Streptomyces TaxID=2593676 RepID=UPI0033B03EFB